jgi:hypothetical protein
MKEEKPFDCILLKDKVQAQLRREFAGLSDEEERARIQHELATSHGVVARKWRRQQEHSVNAAPVPEANSVG